MSGAESALKVVVAADTSMSRDVVRFFLQASDEITIVADAASADDAAWMADKYGADAVVLHSGIAFDAVQDAVVAIRAAAPRARIVVVTPEGGGVPLPVDSRGADSYLEEGVGLADLAFVLTSLCRSPDIAIDLPPTVRAPEETDPIIVVPEPELVMAGALAATAPSRPVAPSAGEPSTEDAPAGPATSPPRRAGFLPLLAAASAFVIAVAFAMYRTPLEQALFPDADTHFAGVDAGSRAGDFLRSSHVRLTALAHSLDGGGDVTTAPALARQLVAQRKRILASGGDVSALDREIETTLRPMVRNAPAGVAVAVLAVIAPVASWANGDLNHLLLNGGPGVSPPPPADAGGTSSGAGATGTATGAGTGVDVGGVPSGGTTGAGGGDAGGSGSGDTGGSGGDNTGGSGSGQGGGLESGGGPGGDGDTDGTGATDGDGSTSSGGDSSGGGGTTNGGQGDTGDGTQVDGTGESVQGDASAPGGHGDHQSGADLGRCEHPGSGGGHGDGHCNRPIKRTR
jgi:hypothetical protein